MTGEAMAAAGVPQKLAEKTKVMYNWLIVFVAFGSIGIHHHDGERSASKCS